MNKLNYYNFSFIENVDEEIRNYELFYSTGIQTIFFFFQ